MKAPYSSTDQIFQNLVIVHGRLEHVMTVEEVHRCHDGTYVVEGRSEHNDRYMSYMSISPQDLEKGRHEIF